MKAFAAAIIGGFGSVDRRALIGGIAVGLAEILGAAYVTSTYKDALVFVLMVVVSAFSGRRGCLPVRISGTWVEGLLFEKKKQKTFPPSRGAEAPREREKSLLLLFFRKKVLPSRAGVRRLRAIIRNPRVGRASRARAAHGSRLRAASRSTPR